MSQCTRFVRKIWSDFIAYGGHDAVSKSTLEIVSAKPGYVEAKMRIQKEHTNRLSSLHGGVICSLVDTIGSLAVCTQGFWQSGVSTDIHTTFIRGAGVEGDCVKIEGRLLNLGKTLAYTETKILHPETGKLLATGLHTKFIGKSHGHPKSVTFDESGDNVVEGKIED